MTTFNTSWDQWGMPDAYERDREDNAVKEQAAQMTDQEAEEFADEIIKLIWLSEFAGKCSGGSVMKALRETN